MNITDIIKNTEKPSIYEKGSSFMWTDEHISKQLLEIHLNPEIDLGSRKMSTIENTAKWILEQKSSGQKLNILDLGCGPGLYSEFFAKQGHHVTGIDISKASIEYARKAALEKQLDITYKNASYLDIDLEDAAYDLVILIYTDFGVLIPDERKILLNKVYKALKKSGVFIFDVLRDTNLDNKVAPKSWEAAEDGFWRNNPYVALSESFLYEEQKVILFQHTIVDSPNKVESYRFWTHFFSAENVEKELNPFNFDTIQYADDVLPASDMWNGDNVLFFMATK